MSFKQVDRRRLGPITRDFAARLRAAREKKGWSQTALAERSGLTRQRVVHFEQGAQHPRLTEIERLATVLGLDVSSLLGIASRGESSGAASGFPRERLEALAVQFRAAADALVEFLGEPPESTARPRPRQPEVKRSPGRPVAPATPARDSGKWPWARIVPAAARLLHENPRRKWKPVELCQAIKAAGVKLETTRGMHFAIVPRLRAAGLIAERPDGTFTASASGEPARKKAPPARESPRQVAEPVKKSASVPALLTAARSLLAADPARVWRAKELVRAVRATGIELRTWRGVHLYLIKHLADEGAIEKTQDGGFTASGPAAKAPKTRSEAPVETAPKADRDEPESDHPDLSGQQGEPASSITEPSPRWDDAEVWRAPARRTAGKQGALKSVLPATRGKTLLIAGGKVSQETQRRALRKGLQLKVVDWITGERSPNPIELFSLAVQKKKYDFVLVMAGTSPQESTALASACQDAGSSVFYLTGAPSVPVVAEAIYSELPGTEG